MKNITSFIGRMNKIGIKIELASNFPWIYIESINGKTVTEKYKANHGFTLAYMNLSSSGTTFEDLGEVFKLIRKYTRDEK